ncbi:MAG: GNAT family N-acetyltransferase [Lachnospiraceae bacterium]|nr:GNAT family N-acetyltransferase [Lachnospiraceae bacterium]
MGDTTINYEELGFGFHTFRKEICAELGEAFWDELVKDIELPDMNSECNCQCHHMYLFMKRLEEMTDKETLKKIFCKVRHGLHPSQCVGTHERFLEIGDLDEYLGDGEDGVEEFARLNREKKDFYGQEITDEVLEFIKQNPKMLTAVRKGNKLYTMAFPYNMKEYLKATDEKMKRYHACHCPFAKESILSGNVVSSALCNCSLGHMLNCYEGFMGRELKGRVIRSVLNGDLTCEYEIEIPDDIMQKYVIADQIIASNYFNYYKAFAQSGIIDLHEGSVSWIIPCKGEKGPSLGFGIHLNEENAETELKALGQGIRKGEAPQMWIVTPDATPDNIIEIMERNGFKNLSGDDDEPAMLLRKKDYRPYREEHSHITCQRISRMEDFRLWIDVVNTALHGWDMIDAEHYFTWVENEHIKIYLAKIDGVAVSTCATIQNGNTASLEFVSTLEQYRRKKAAALLSSYAIDDLLNNGAETVTLGACGDAVHLYKGLGFKKYFNNIILQYEL